MWWNGVTLLWWNGVNAIGNLEKVTIHSATITQSTNGYACSTALVCPHISGNIPVGDHKALAVLPAYTPPSQYEAGILAHKNHNAKSSLVKQMADLSDERIESYYQVSKFDPQEATVQFDSEIVNAVLNPKNAALYAKYASRTFEKGKYFTLPLSLCDYGISIFVLLHHYIILFSNIFFYFMWWNGVTLL